MVKVWSAVCLCLIWAGGKSSWNPSANVLIAQLCCFCLYNQSLNCVRLCYAPRCFTFMWLPGLPHPVLWKGGMKCQFWSHKRETIQCNNKERWQNTTLNSEDRGHSVRKQQFGNPLLLRKAMHYANKTSYDIWMSQEDRRQHTMPVKYKYLYVILQLKHPTETEHGHCWTHKS